MSENRDIDLFAYMMGKPDYYIERKQTIVQKNDRDNVQSCNFEQLDQELSKFEGFEEKVKLFERIVKDYSDYINKY